MTTLPDLLLAADEVTATIPSEAIVHLAINPRPAPGQGEIQVQLDHGTRLGALLEAAADMDLQQVTILDAVPNLHRVTGMHGDLKVLIFA